MALTNTQLRYYDSNVFRLPADKRKAYHAQVDRLIDELCKTVKDETEIKTTRVMKAGSFAKFTILRKTTYDPVDVDVVFYISGQDASKATLDSLSAKIYDLLIKIYPNKSVEDFEIQRKAATVTFVGTDLPLNFHPDGIRASAVCTPSGAGLATNDWRSFSTSRSRSFVAGNLPGR